jgi:hypothetical protein
MPRDGSLTPADLLGCIQVINVEYLKCDRRAAGRLLACGTISAFKRCAA